MKFGPPSTATPAEKKRMGIVWCTVCQYETLRLPDGVCGFCECALEPAKRAA